MKVEFSAQFEKEYARVPLYVRRAFDKKLPFLIKNLRHPSLRAKKYDESRDIWQARITKNYRFYFRIDKDIYKIISIVPHPK